MFFSLAEPIFNTSVTQFCLLVCILYMDIIYLCISTHSLYTFCLYLSIGILFCLILWWIISVMCNCNTWNSPKNNSNSTVWSYLKNSLRKSVTNMLTSHTIVMHHRCIQTDLLLAITTVALTGLTSCWMSTCLKTHQPFLMLADRQILYSSNSWVIAHNKCWGDRLGRQAKSGARIASCWY